MRRLKKKKKNAFQIVEVLYLLRENKLLDAVAMMHLDGLRDKVHGETRDDACLACIHFGRRDKAGILVVVEGCFCGTRCSRCMMQERREKKKKEKKKFFFFFFLPLSCKTRRGMLRCRIAWQRIDKSSAMHDKTAAMLWMAATLAKHRCI